MSGWIMVAAAGALWTLLAWWANRLMRVPIRPGDLSAAMLWRVLRLYTRLVHRLRVEGVDHVPDRRDGRGRALIIVANHSAGTDPLLIQSVTPFEVKWMMAADMRHPLLEPFWRVARVIYVDRISGGGASLREAMRHLRAGGAIGVFPEGHIARPPRTVLPFQGGVGVMIKRSKADVLPVIVDGTPQTDTAWGALFRPSRSVVRFLPVVRYGAADSPESITDDLRRRFVEATGWPPFHRVPKLERDPPIMVDMDGRYVDPAGRVYSDEEVAA